LAIQVQALGFFERREVSKIDRKSTWTTPVLILKSEGRLGVQELLVEVFAGDRELSSFMEVVRAVLGSEIKLPEVRGPIEISVIFQVIV